MAFHAWPRLAEYFARFQLSRELHCSLEVLAPKLSLTPLFVRSSLEREKRWGRSPEKQGKADGEEEWTEDMAETNSDDSSADASTPHHIEQEKDAEERQKTVVAVSAFLKRTVELKNVARSLQNIGFKRGRGVCPTLEVSLIVCGPQSNHQDSPPSESTRQRGPSQSDEDHTIEVPSARLTMIRMVNRVPLLDGAEAAACGLVQGVSSMQCVWSSFGLEVLHGKGARSPTSHSPTFLVRDSENVRPFFERKTTHRLYDEAESLTSDDESSASVSQRADSESKKRKRNAAAPFMLPAHLRLGDILLIIQINSDPKSLPLPTLSKVSLSFFHGSGIIAQRASLGSTPTQRRQHRQSIGTGCVRLPSKLANQ